MPASGWNEDKRYMLQHRAPGGQTSDSKGGLSVGREPVIPANRRSLRLLVISGFPNINPVHRESGCNLLSEKRYSYMVLPIDKVG